MIAIFITVLIFLLGSISLAAINTAIQKIGYLEFKEAIKRHPYTFFILHLIQKTNKEDRIDEVLNFISHTQQIARLCFGIIGTLLIISLPTFNAYVTEGIEGLEFSLLFVICMVLFFIFLTVILDTVTHILTATIPYSVLKILTWTAYIFLVIFYPITYVSLSVQRRLSEGKDFAGSPGAEKRFRRRLIELLDETDSEKSLDNEGQRIMIAISNLGTRLCKEVMIPRVNITSLSENTTFRDAASVFIKENYSRIPIYHTSQDDIVGVVHFKDLFSKLYEKREGTLKELVRPVLFAPETKKISILLKEFQKKQIHMAIIVDEYGGTEGLITVEDILEEIVGDIFDEYDHDEIIAKIDTDADGSFLVDAKMNLIDIESMTSIIFPKLPDYDTLGGLIYHKAGTIPKIGYKIFLDTFSLEVIKGSDRLIETVRVTPTSLNEDLLE
ncbi:MAG: hemolysin family protein [Chlamydiia bacterium]